MLKKFLIGTVVALALLVSTTASAAMDFGPTTLKVGSKGEYVKTLQTLVGAVADGNFGPATKAKVATWQASCGGLTVDGVFGAMSKEKANAGCASMGGSFPAGCTSNTGFSTTTGASCAAATSTVPGCTAGALFSSTTGASCTTGTTTPSGVEGILSNVNKLGSYNNTKIMESDKDKVVFGFEVTAKDADQVIDGLSLAFKNTNGASSLKFGKYATDLSVWLDGKEIGRKSVAAYSDDASDIYTYRFTGMNGIVKKDMKGVILVAVSGASTIDSTDATNEVWNVVTGTSVSSPTSNFISAVSANGRYRDYGTALTVAVIDFQKAGSGDQKLKVTTSASNPLAQTVQVSNTSDTSDVLLAAFDVKAENAAMRLQKVPVTLVVTGTDGTVSNTAVAKTVKLYANGTLIGSESVLASGATTEVITFGNTSKLQYTIASNATVKFEVKADLNDIENSGVASTDFDNGDKIKASVDSSTMTVEIDNANQDTVTNKTGTVNGEDMTLRATGVQVTMGAMSTTGTPNNAGEILSRTVTIPVTIKSFDDTVYVDDVAENAATPTGTQALAFVFEDAAGATKVIANSVTFVSNNAPIEGSGYRIDAGTEKTFTLTAIVTGTTAHAQKQYRIQAVQVNSYSNSALSTGQALQTLAPTNTYESGYFSLNLN